MAYLTVSQFATANNLSVATVRRYIHRGILDHKQLGGKGHRILVPADALDQPEESLISGSNSSAKAEPTKSPERLPGPQPRWQS